MPSDPPVHSLALRVTLAFALALTVAEARDLELSFIAAVIATALAFGPAVSAASVVILPLLVWVFASLALVLAGAFSINLPLFFVCVTLGCLWVGFILCGRTGLVQIVGLLILLVSCLIPLRFMAYPEAAGPMVTDMTENVLIGVATTFVVGLVLRGPAKAENPPLPISVFPPLTAALVLTLGTYLVWILEPPGAGSAIASMILVLRPDRNPGYGVVRGRLVGAFLGGGLAVVAATVSGIAPVLPALFLVLMVLGWPLALRAVPPGPWQVPATKSLFAMAILVGEGFSPLFENTEERFGIRIAGVLLGLIYAALAIYFLGPRRSPQPAVERKAPAGMPPAATGPGATDSGTPQPSAAGPAR